MNQIPLPWIHSLVWCFFFYFGTLTLDVKYKFLICSPVDPCSPAVLHDPESPRRRSRGRVETSSEPPNKVVVMSMTSGPLKPQPLDLPLDLQMARTSADAHSSGLAFI